MDLAKKTFGNNIAMIRVRSKLTQEQLAERAGISIRMLQRLEYGETFAGGPTIDRLSRALRVPVSELFASKRDALFKSFNESAHFLTALASKPLAVQQLVLSIVLEDPAYLSDRLPAKAAVLLSQLLKSLSERSEP